MYEELEAKIAEFKQNEERYKEFIRMHEMMIQHLKEENEMLRQRNKDLENNAKKTEQEIARKRDRDNYDKFMISFKKAT